MFDIIEHLFDKKWIKANRCSKMTGTKTKMTGTKTGETRKNKPIFVPEPSFFFENLSFLPKWGLGVFRPIKTQENGSTMGKMNI